MLDDDPRAHGAEGDRARGGPLVAEVDVDLDEQREVARRVEGVRRVIVIANGWASCWMSPRMSPGFGSHDASIDQPDAWLSWPLTVPEPITEDATTRVVEIGCPIWSNRSIRWQIGMTRVAKIGPALICLALVTACGGDGDEDVYAGADPRCAQACAIGTPAVDDAFEVCSTASARLCVDACEARIAGVTGVCATCLVEDARFRPDPIDIAADCDGSTCRYTGWGGTCTFVAGNREAEQDCLRTAYPRRDVACDAEWRPVTECASSCASS